MRRLFAYGCSYTNWSYPTWADLIGISYDEYYNRGLGGVCNQWISDRVLKDNLTYNFNPDTDTILVATTGVNRFTWYDGKSWHHHGDLDSWQENVEKSRAKAFLREMWNIDWAILHGMTGIIRTKSLLKALGVPHKIFEGVRSLYWLDEAKNIDLGYDATQSLQFVKEKCLDNSTSIDDYFVEYKQQIKGNIRYAYNASTGIDGHPPIYIHYNYVKHFLPEYVTEIGDNFFSYTESEFFNKDFPSGNDRSNLYRAFLKRYYPNVKDI